MRIISDFHDYYDVGMQNGIDPQLPYRRFRQEERISYIHKLGDIYYSSLFDDYCIEQNRILFFGFAGKVYPALEHVNDSEEATYIFELDKIVPKSFDDAVCQKLHFDDAVRRMLRCGRTNSRQRAEKDCLAQIKKELKEMFALKDDKRLLGLFDEFKTAIFVWWLESRMVIVNERLNQYGFQKVLPPMQAFQELEMYVGACLTKPTIEEPPIPDKVKVEIHGFDKHSFRKDKSKNK